MNTKKFSKATWSFLIRLRDGKGLEVIFILAKSR
jgi:hypothetical protein